MKKLTKVTTKYRVEEHHANSKTYLLYGIYNTYKQAERKFLQKSLEGITGLIIVREDKAIVQEIVKGGSEQ